MSFLLGSCCAASGRTSKRDRELLSSERTEIVAGAADRDHERVVAHRAGRRDYLAFGVVARRDLDLPARAVEAGHLADPITEMVI